MKAIIMAGGSGTRLRPLTCTLPKPMARVMNKPLLEHITELLKKHGIRDIGITLRYLPESIKNYFGDGSGFGVNLTYFTEEQPLGTAGAVFAAGDFLDDDFLVISGDALCDIDLTAAIDFHKRNKAEATLILYSMEVPIEYGVVVTGEGGRILRFLEKPDWSRVFSDTVNTGIYILNPSVFKGFSGGNFDFSKDVFPKLLSEGRGLFGFNGEGYWCDIGDVDVYRHCHYDIFDGKINLRLDAREIKSGVFVGDGAVIEEGATINAPAFIGRGSKIRSGASIDSYSVIGENVLVGTGASIKRSVVGNGCNIGENTQIRGAVLCERCVVRRGSAIFEQAVIGEGTLLGENTEVKPGVKVWPYKNVAACEVINSNLVWGRGRVNELFGESGISGEVGTDITPFVASNIGAALCKIAGGGKIGVSSDGEASSVMLKNAVSAGLMSGGAAVYDFGEQPSAITRSGIRFYGLSAGVHTETLSGGKNIIKLINEYGADVNKDTERELRLLLDRSDFAYAPPADIKEINDLYEYKMYYLRELINSVQNREIGMNILVMTESRWVQRLLSGAAADLGCKITILNRATSLKNMKELTDFAKTVKDGGYTFGAATDRAGESVVLADEKGRIIDRDMYKVLAALLIMRRYGGEVIVDISAPSAIDALAEKYGAEVRRTRDSVPALMAELCKNAALPRCRDSFMFFFDAVGAIIKLIDFLKTENLKLSELADEIPEYYIVRKEISCAEKDKGRLIRELTKLGEKESIDGVRIVDKNGYILVIPHGSKPVCKMIIETGREEYAAELAEAYTGKIDEILKSNKK